MSIYILGCRFAEHKPRQGEKGLLRDVAKKEVRFPRKEAIAEAAHKVFVLLQTWVGRYEIKASGSNLSNEDMAKLSAEQKEIAKTAGQLLSCFVEIARHRGRADALLAALRLAKSIRRRTWENCDGQCVRQLGELPRLSIGSENRRSFLNCQID